MATVVVGMKALWDSGATDIIIKREKTKPYEFKISYNKVEYSNSAGTYFTTHYVKAPFFIPELSSSKIISLSLLHQ